MNQSRRIKSAAGVAGSSGTVKMSRRRDDGVYGRRSGRRRYGFSYRGTDHPTKVSLPVHYVVAGASAVNLVHLMAQ